MQLIDEIYETLNTETVKKKSAFFTEKSIQLDHDVLAIAEPKMDFEELATLGNVLTSLEDEYRKTAFKVGFETARKLILGEVTGNADD